MINRVLYQREPYFRTFFIHQSIGQESIVNASGYYYLPHRYPNTFNKDIILRRLLFETLKRHSVSDKPTRVQQNIAIIIAWPMHLRLNGTPSNRITLNKKKDSSQHFLHYFFWGALLPTTGINCSIIQTRTSTN